MLNISTTKQKVTRTVTAKMRLLIEGELKDQEVRIVYESLSAKDAREAGELAKRNDKKGEVFFLSEIIINNYNLKRLPDFVDDDEQEVDVTIALLEDFDLYNLKVIQKAILEDSDPK